MEKSKSITATQQGNKNQKVEIISMTVKVIGWAMFLLAGYYLLEIASLLVLRQSYGYGMWEGWQGFVSIGIPFVYSVGLFVASFGIRRMHRWALYLFIILTSLAIVNSFFLFLHLFSKTEQFQLSTFWQLTKYFLTFVFSSSFSSLSFSSIPGFAGIQILITIYFLVISKRFT